MANYYYFMIVGFAKPFGYVHASTVAKVNWGENWTVDEDRKFMTFNGGNTFEERNRRMEQTLQSNPKVDDASAFGRWCDELFPVYDAEGQHIFDIDGAGVDAFGIVNFACHLIACTKTSEGTRYWVPRRAKTKLSYPNMLDNTVGGSLASGEKPFDCIIRECEEEASLPAQYTRANITACGSLS